MHAINESRQLWFQTDNRSRVAALLERQGYVKLGERALRILTWPDRRPCLVENLYLMALLRSGRSIGSVNCYAAQLSLVVRYLAKTKRAIWNVDDDWLTEFSKWLGGPTLMSVRGRATRKPSQINRIIHRALAFFLWIQERFTVSPPLIGKFGAGGRITIEIRKTGRGVGYLWHPSLLASAIGPEVEPMTRETFLRLYDASCLMAKSKYVVARTRLLLSLYADTGARRCELASLTVKDIKEAVQRGDGKIRLRTAKREPSHSRLVPIPEATLQQAMSFVRIFRARVIAKLRLKGGLVNESDALFLTTTGTPLGIETITQEFHRLKRAAGVTGRASGHMLRHRWITLQVVERLSVYQSERLPVDIGTTLLTKVASMTGHRRLSSLKPYLHLASDELGIWEEGKERIESRLAKDAQNRAKR